MPSNHKNPIVQHIIDDDDTSFAGREPDSLHGLIEWMMRVQATREAALALDLPPLEEEDDDYAALDAEIRQARDTAR